MTLNLRPVVGGLSDWFIIVSGKRELVVDVTSNVARLLGFSLYSLGREPEMEEFQERKRVAKAYPSWYKTNETAQEQRSAQKRARKE